jgi:hypothetical protein
MRLDTSPNPPRMGKELKWPEQRVLRIKNLTRRYNHVDPSPTQAFD